MVEAIWSDDDDSDFSPPSTRLARAPSTSRPLTTKKAPTHIIADRPDSGSDTSITDEVIEEFDLPPELSWLRQATSLPGAVPFDDDEGMDITEIGSHEAGTGTSSDPFAQAIVPPSTTSSRNATTKRKPLMPWKRAAQPSSRQQSQPHEHIGLAMKATAAERNQPALRSTNKAGVTRSRARR